MNIWNFLTADVRLNPIASRQYFSRLRFSNEDKRVKKLELAPLPNWRGELPRGGKGPVLFAVADARYFARFANMFASSAALASPQSAVHIHILGDKDDLSEFDFKPNNLAISFEEANFEGLSLADKGRYCQCMRFVRLAQFVKQTGLDYVSFDIDGLFQKSFDDFNFYSDVGLILRPEYADPGLRVNAGVVYMRATEVAQNFMDQASTQMLRHLQHAPFIEKLDQRCLSLAVNEFVGALPKEIYTFEPGQGYFYSAKGKAKNTILVEVYDEFLRSRN